MALTNFMSSVLMDLQLPVSSCVRSCDLSISLCSSAYRYTWTLLGMWNVSVYHSATTCSRWQFRGSDVNLMSIPVELFNQLFMLLLAVTAFFDVSNICI